FKEFEYILLPNSPTPAFPIGSHVKDPIALYLADIFTVFSNLTGLPAISLPLFWHSNGLPFGVQVMANHFREKELLRLSEEWVDQFKVNKG
ncbi:MAG: amidase family protein, partial [Chitinophagaceae bacterium]